MLCRSSLFSILYLLPQNPTLKINPAKKPSPHYQVQDRKKASPNKRILPILIIDEEFNSLLFEFFMIHMLDIGIGIDGEIGLYCRKQHLDSFGNS